MSSKMLTWAVSLLLIFSGPLAGQGSGLPDRTSVPSVLFVDVPEHIKRIVRTAICHLPAGIAQGTHAETPLPLVLDAPLPLVIVSDTLAVEVGRIRSCSAVTDLSLIRRMEFIRGITAVMMYGPRARAGALQVYLQRITRSDR